MRKQTRERKAAGPARPTETVVQPPSRARQSPEELEPPRFIEASLQGPRPEFFNRLQNLADTLSVDELARKTAALHTFVAHHRPQALPRLMESGLGPARPFFARAFGEKERPRAAVDFAEVLRALAKAPAALQSVLLKHLYNFYWMLSLQCWESRFSQLNSQCARAAQLQALLTEKGAPSDIETQSEDFLRKDSLLAGCDDPSVGNTALNRFYQRAFNHHFPGSLSKA